MRKYLILLVLPFFAGCVEKHGIKEFVELCYNHKEITNETNDALGQSITEEITKTTDKDKQDALLDLAIRLKVIQRQSDLISEYVNVTEVNADLIGEMVKTKWRKK